MTWYDPLLSDSSASGILVGVAVSGAVGMLLGSIKVRGISLGVAGALFAGIAWQQLVWSGHAPASSPVNAASHGHNTTIEFLREFGLILFVYAIGLTVGPGFFSRLKAQGLRWNALAALVVFGGCGVTALVHAWLALPGGLAVGLLAGAVTNTPSLAAAGQALGSGPTAVEAIDLAAAGYAIAYPLGIVGIITTMLILKYFAQPKAQSAIAIEATTDDLQRLTLEIVNPGAVNMTIKNLRETAGDRIIISRLVRAGELIVPSDDVNLALGDVVLGVGDAANLEKLQHLCGARSTQDVLAVSGDLHIRHVMVSNHQIALKPLGALDPLQTHGVTVTRLTRAGIELLATPNVILHRGDRLRVVGSTEATERFAKLVGDSMGDLDKPELLPLLIGIALGVILGSIPIMIPGMPAPLKLGLAGGPLLVALLVASRGRLGPVDIYLPSAAVNMMRELGILLFLSCVGLLSGEAFMKTLMSAQGPLLVGVGVLVTVIPLLIVGLIALLWMRRSYGEVAGLLAGSMTDPPALAFAQATNRGDGPARIYSTVYPLTMLLRIAMSQTLMLLWV